MIEIARRLRRESTMAERIVWEMLRGRRLGGLKFRRQHVLQGYIVDFYCHEAKFCLELDGAPHLVKEQAEKDTARDIHLRSRGFNVLRAMNDEALANKEWLRQRILDACRAGSIAPPL
jgi:very-short-patch-repair endonuclease